MNQFLNEEVRKVLKDILSEMQDEVHIKLYVDELTCETCSESHQLMEEIKELNEKLHYELVETKGDKELGAIYDISYYPTFVVLDKDLNDKGIRFNGIPAGHEINAFLSAILDMSGKALDFDAATIERIKAIDHETNIKVFVTLSCPHCSGAVSKAHRIAFLNPLVKAEMVEAGTFPDLSMKYNVSSVPKIVINDQIEFVGNQALETFLDKIESVR